MKPDHRQKTSPQTAQAKPLKGPSDQGNTGVGPADRIDLREAVVGEYRFQGELIRAFYVGGRTWFVAAEVCAALDLVNPRMVVKSLRPTQRGVSTMDTPGGAQTVNLITEGAIYVLVFKSRKPQADAFQSWVTDEVLPQIRRTGSYSVNGQISQDGSIVLPPLDGVTRYVVVGVPGEAPHIRRTGLTEMVAENTSLDVQGLCYAVKAIEVWWNKLQILNRSLSDRDQGFSARQLEKAILEGGALADRYLGLLTYLSADGIA
jgi:hypothetical protein